MGLCALGCGLWIQFGVKEREADEAEKEKVVGLCQTISYISRFCKNRILRNYMGFILTQRIFWSPFDMLFIVLML